METEAKKQRGGQREGAGRKRAEENARDPQHASRPQLDSNNPLHVMLQTVKGVPTLRQRKMYDAMHDVLAQFLGRPDFRVVHISMQRNHLHLIVEAKNADALSRGMQGLASSAARAINKACGREGKVFRFRYKAKQIKTRDYARNAIAYVLNNWRRHGESWSTPNQPIDMYSSAITFSGWKGEKRWRVPDRHKPLPVSRPRTSLLNLDWQWYGLIDPWEVPGQW